MSTKQTMSTEEIRARVNEAFDGDKIAAVDLKAIETYLSKLEYRAEYNKRPEVIAKRKAYMAERRQTEKVGKQRIAQLMQQLMSAKKEE